MEVTALHVERRPYRAMLIALALYAVCSPLSTYNTLAMFGFVQSRMVALQLTITGVMILFATVAGTHMSRHCMALEQGKRRVLWLTSFWIIGPPALYAFYHLKLKRKA